MSRHAAPRRRRWWAWGAFGAAVAFLIAVVWIVAPNPDAPRTGVMPTGTPSSSGSPKPSVTRTPSPKASTPASRPTSTRPTPTPTPTTARPSTTPPRPPVTPSPTSTASIRFQALYLINGERAKAGLKPLAEYPGMSAYANDWAEEMDRADVLVHSSNNPYSAEVIASGATSASQAVSLWMNSPPHRDIILNPAYDKVGIGFVDGYWCAVFS